MQKIKELYELIRLAYCCCTRLLRIVIIRLLRCVEVS